MRSALELAVFALISVGLLMLGLATRSLDGAAASAGTGGVDLVSMEASTASLETMVQEWLEPPDVTDAPEPPRMEQVDLAMMTPERAPVMPVPTPAVPRMQAPDVPTMTLPELPAMPDTATADLPPPPPPEPEPDPEPEPEPEPVPEPEPEPEISELAPAASTRAPPRPERLEQPPPKRQARQQPRQTQRQPAAAASSRASADSSKQTAAGSGGGSQAGESRQGQAATVNKAQQNSLKARWGATIRSRIERRKRYPAAAGRTSATVGLWLKVSSSGTLAGAGITRSSGNVALDQAALNAVRQARLPAAPRGLANGSHSFSLSMRFTR